jgi:hypothetical protein
MPILKNPDWTTEIIKCQWYCHNSEDPRTCSKICRKEKAKSENQKNWEILKKIEELLN